MSDTTDGTIGDRPRHGDDLRLAAQRRARPAPLPSAARLAADRHSRRVRRLKVLLPAAAVIVAVAIAGIAWVQSRLLGSLDVKSVLFSKDGLTMVEPHLTGHAEGRSYDVSAQRAFQNIQNPKIIGLEGIDGRIEMANGTWAKIESVKGLYDGTREWLTLDGSVTVTTSSGWNALSEHAEVNLVDGHIQSNTRVRITGRSGMIEADALDVSDAGHHILFTGNVSMTFQPGEASAEAGSDPSAAPRRP